MFVVMRKKGKRWKSKKGEGTLRAVSTFALAFCFCFHCHSGTRRTFRLGLLACVCPGPGRLSYCVHVSVIRDRYMVHVLSLTVIPKRVLAPAVCLASDFPRVDYPCASQKHSCKVPSPTDIDLFSPRLLMSRRKVAGGSPRVCFVTQGKYSVQAEYTLKFWSS